MHSKNPDGRHSTTAPSKIPFPTAAPATARSSDEIRVRVAAWILQELGLGDFEIDTTAPFEAYGLRSVALSAMALELEDWLRKPVTPATLYRYPTVDALASHLAD